MDPRCHYTARVLGLGLIVEAMRRQGVDTEFRQYP
jgi:hypothetical protein